MSMKRRDFIRNGALGATVLPNIMLAEQPAFFDQEKKSYSTTSDPVQSISTQQALHQDFQSALPGTEYYFIGNGFVQAVLQSSENPESGTHCGLFIMSPEHFCRKASTFLFHPERGAQNTRLYVTVDGKTYLPEYATSSIRWEYPDGIPVIVLEWEAGAAHIREEYWAAIDVPTLVRSVTVRVPTGAAQVKIMALLYPNLMLFDEYVVDREKKILTAKGYINLSLSSAETSGIGDRQLYFDFGTVATGRTKKADLVYSIETQHCNCGTMTADELRTLSAQYWRHTAGCDFGNEKLNHLFNVSKSALRGSVADSGKTDGGVWQYNFEWVRDQSMVVTAALMTGQRGVARDLLERILTRSVDERGSCVDASRPRPFETIELDQNGQLIVAIWNYRMWTGDDSFVHDHWEKIVKLADFVLRPELRDPASGLLKNFREYWERDSGHGVREGFENPYQLWNIIGFEKAAELAVERGEIAHAHRWSAAGAELKAAYLSHPRFSLIENGMFIKRRLTTGEMQSIIEPKNRAAMPQGMPLQTEKISYLDPDTSSVFPIIFEVVDPKSDISLKTLASMEALWNQRWQGGGYGRYHVSSEPDSPGGWPFPTVFLARAYHEAGNDAMVWRALDWLLSVQGGKAGAWYEFYGSRPTPPLPPVGFLPWTWAELVMLFMHHVLGVRPHADALWLRPKLLSGVDKITSIVIVRGQKIALTIHRSTGSPRCTAAGSSIPVIDGVARIPYPTEDISVEMFV